MDLGEWEGLYKKQIKEHWPEIYGQWRGDRPAEFRLLSGRFPIRDVWQRAEAVWARVLGDADAAGKARGGQRGPHGDPVTLVTGHNGINQALSIEHCSVRIRPRVYSSGPNPV